jgi:hypothetical protein
VRVVKDADLCLLYRNDFAIDPGQSRHRS